MPMLDAYIPEGALHPADEKELVAKLTDILLEWEGADPTNPVARSIAWVFLHRPTEVYVAGEVPDEPRYRIVASVPEGQLDAQRRQGMVEAVTKAVLDAEPEGRSSDPFRVWVFASSVPEGTWGGGGRIVSLADIVTFVLDGDAAAGEAHAKRRLAAAKAERDAVFQ
jgi:phenylpyruvate tautomerase PptA (4-oxalocrotonate tautomerase family)